MLKLCILSFLVVLVNGKWMPIIIYSNNPAPILTKCAEYEFANKNNSEECQCGDRNNVPVIEITNLRDNTKEDGPILIVNSSAEVVSSLQLNCTCAGQPKALSTVRVMNANYFIKYDSEFSANDQYSNRAIIFVQQLPSAAELKAMTEYDDVIGKQGTVLCLPVLYTD